MIQGQSSMTKGKHSNTSLPAEKDAEIFRTASVGLLQYESGRDRATRDPQQPMVSRMLLFVVALGIGAGSTSFITVMGLLALRCASDPHIEKKVLAIVSMALLAGSTALIANIVRTASKWPFLGFLLGSGATVLIEGIYFAFN
jgi:hypothetical protein